MNLLSEANLTQARCEHVQGLIRQIEQQLPFLVSLSADEKKRIYRKGDKQIEYIRKTLIYAKRLPHLVPSYVDVGRMDHDLYIADQLQQLLEKVEDLTGRIRDTRAAYYEQAFDAARAAYKGFGHASDTGIHQADKVFEELKQYFPRTGKRLTHKK